MPQCGGKDNHVSDERVRMAARLGEILHRPDSGIAAVIEVIAEPDLCRELAAERNNMPETKDVTIKLTLEGQPIGGYTVTVYAAQVTEFSAAHLEFLHQWGAVSLVVKD